MVYSVIYLCKKAFYYKKAIDRGNGMNTKDIYQKILNGRAIIIAGSGINIDVKDCDGNDFLTGSRLAERIYEECGISNPDNKWDLQDASQTYLEKKTDLQLISLIKRLLNVSQLSDIVKKTYQLPWIRYYTTNYDDVPLLATNGVKDIIPVTLNSNVNKYFGEDNVCVYINGYIGNLNEHTLNSEFKLTSNSYMSEQNILNSQWGNVLKEDLELAEVIIIAGLSLEYDLELKKIIYNQNIVNKTVFIESKIISEDKKRKLGRLGTVLAIGIEKFIEELYLYKDSGFVPEKNKERLYCFEKNSRQPLPTRAKSHEVFALFMSGEIQNSLFYKDKGKYVSIIYRERVANVVSAIKEQKRVIFLHANLGNGKTLFLEIMKRQLYNNSINVYTFLENRNRKEFTDINVIMKSSGQKVIIIENYFNHLDIMKKFALCSCEEVTFVLTARTMIYETKMQDIFEYLDVQYGDCISIDINKLTKREINECYKILEKYEFWGNYTKLNQQDKKNLLKKRSNGNGELQTILIDIIRSSKMREKISDVVKKIKNEANEYYLGLIILLLAKVMSLELSVDDVNGIMDNECLNDPRYVKNAAVKELVIFEDNGKQSYRIKSSIVAKEILSMLNTDAEIIDALIKIAQYSNKYSESFKYESILQNIVSFSHVNTFLSGKRDNIDFIINYYDALKEFKYYKENSFFWLQYSIACLRYENYELAQNYVTVAYQKFKEDDKNKPFQCDNQQARILLELIRVGKSKNVKKDFSEAHSLIIKPRVSEKDREENSIRLFYTYIKKSFIQNVSKAHALDFHATACSDAYNKVNIYLKNLKNERDRERYEDLKKNLLLHSVTNKAEEK